MKFLTICRLLVVISVGAVLVQGCTKNTGSANAVEDLERKYLRSQLKSCIGNTKYDSSVDFFVLHSRWFETAETTTCANGDDEAKVTCWEDALDDILPEYHTMSSIIKRCIATYKTAAIPVTEWGNANGAPCVLPFIFNETQYETCIGEYVAEGFTWCSTTFNYDVDKKWGYCPPAPQTYGATANGAPCTFPFMYKGVEYNECITVDEGSEWCATTYDADTDKKWGFCSPGPKTVGGTENGTPCSFPFMYKGVQYNKCTVIDEGSKWCATTFDADTDEQWGYCPPGPKTIGGNSNGALCTFPFMRQGVEYNECTIVGGGPKWCATTYDYDTDGKWGRCA